MILKFLLGHYTKRNKMQGKAILSIFAVLFFVYNVSATCNLGGRWCNDNTDCQYDTFGNNKCTLFTDPFGYQSRYCATGGTSYSGPLCPMLGLYCNPSLNCSLATDGATWCNSEAIKFQQYCSGGGCVAPPPSACSKP